jgi:prepilin-type N-terminal cleavage/methylation domain-containing protein
MRSGHRNDAGFSLPELLVTMTIAMTVSLAAFALVEFVMKRAAETEQRVEATQRGRIALETMTRQLRSQVCLTKGGAVLSTPIVDGTANQVTFYTDLSDAASVAPYPEKHVLTYSSTAKTIIEEDYTSVNGTTWTLRLRRTLLTDVKPELKPGGAAEDVFSYYAYDYDATRTPKLLTTALTPPLGATNAKRVVQVKVAFRTAPRAKNVRTSVDIPFRDDVFVRSVNPNELATGTNPAPVPTCA